MHTKKRPQIRNRQLVLQALIAIVSAATASCGKQEGSLIANKPNKCILSTVSKKPRLKIEFDEWNGVLKGTLFTENRVTRSVLLSCSNGSGFCYVDGQPIIGINGNQKSREIDKLPDMYLIPGIAKNARWNRSSECINLLRLVY